MNLPLLLYLRKIKPKPLRRR